MNRQELLEAIKPRMQDRFPAIIDCGEGWDQLISDLYEELEKIDPDFTIAQIKEKFGGLRFYADLSTGYDKESPFYKAIAEAESKSYKTCELTGKPGVLMRSEHGWIRTLDPETAPVGYEIVGEKSE